MEKSAYKLRLPVGITDFRELVTCNYLFADKSLFVKDVMEDGAKVLLITRPRRFGKTLNLSMLQHFLQQNDDHEKNLFENLAISKDTAFCKEHQNQYPVIFISFKEVKKSTYKAAYRKIVGLIRELYEQHRYLLEGDLLSESEKKIFLALCDKTAEQDDVESAIKQLSMYMEKKFKKNPIILIDEYDTPIQQAYLKKYYEKMIDLMRSIFGAALKDNDFLHKAVVTGIARVAQESLFSGVSNLDVYTLLREEYGQYFGFTESEVIKLIEGSGKEAALPAIKEWYNGYRVGRYILYNPWSIISCLKNHGKLAPYWLNTARNDLIQELLTDADDTIRSEFEFLLQGKSIEKPILENLVFPELKTEEGAIWSLLLYAGYLNVISTELGEFELMAQVSIPNKEVMYVYNAMVAGWFKRDNSLVEYKKFIHSLSHGDMATFKKCLSEYILESGSFFEFGKNAPEKVFHSFMLGIVVGLKGDYIISSNQESGLGRFDVVLIPRTKEKNGILLEFKTSETVDKLLDKAQEALQQIKDKQYIETLKKDGITSVLAIGLAFCGKKMDLVSENFSIAKNQF